MARGDDLTLRVKADTEAAVKSFQGLTRSIETVEKQTDETSSSLSKLDKTKATPEVKLSVNQQAINRAKAEIDRLRSQIARDIAVGADTRLAQRRIAELQGAIKKLDKQTVTVDVKTTGVAQAQSKLAGMGAEVGRLRGKLGFGGGELAAVLVAAGVGMVKLAADAESARVRLNGLFGSVEEGGRIFEKIQIFAKTTPFEFPEVLRATATLKSFGVQAEDIFKVLTALGDTAARAAAPIGDVALIYGQMLAKGKVQAEELLQLQERGIPAMEALARAQGITVAQAQEFATQGKLGREAIEGMAVELGKMNMGAMVEQSKTLNAQWSNIKDNTAQAGASIGTVIGPQLAVAAENANALLGPLAKLGPVLSGIQKEMESNQLLTGNLPEKSVKDLRDVAAAARATAEELARQKVLGKPAAETIDVLAERSNAAAVAQREFAKMIDRANGEITDYVSKIDILNGRFADGRELTANYEQAVDDLAETMVEGKRTMDLGTEAGRRNDEGLRRIAETLDAVTRRRIEDAVRTGQSTTKIVSDYGKQREALIKTATQLFGNRKEAEKYVDELLATPKEITTDVNLTGAKEAEAEIKNLTKPRQVMITATLSRDAAKILEDFRTQGGSAGRSTTAPRSAAPSSTVVVRPRIFIDGTAVKAAVRGTTAPASTQERGRL